LCGSIASSCGCSGKLVGVPCYDPTGYSPAPLSGLPVSSCAPVP
jgi:hypothetical protein